MTSFENHIEVLKRKIKKREVIFFVGAGISFNSGVPTVNQIYPELAKALGIEINEFKRITEGYPFERVMQNLLCDEDIKNHFKKLFSQKNPSKIHYFLAEKLQRGSRNVLTTNFDQLIEIAFHELHNDNLKILLPKDFLKKEPVKVKSLIKLHGCISENIKDLGVTINAVASKGNRERIQVIIEKVISSKFLILMLGYSGSDIFDIIPAMSEIAKSGCTLYYIKHSDIEQPMINALEPPFNTFKGIEFKCETSAFIDLISELPIQKSIHKEPVKDWICVFEDWKEDISKYKGLKESERLGQFYAEREEHNKSIDHYRFCLKILKENNGFGFPHWIPLMMNQLAQSLRFTYSKETNKEYLMEALELSKDSVEYYNSIKVTQQLLKAVENKEVIRIEGTLVRDYTNALGAYALALRIAGKIPEAISYYLQILEVCKFGGYEENICTTYSNLAFIYRETNPKKSEDFCIKALELCDKYPQHYKRCYFGIADAYLQMANLAFINNTPDEALKFLYKELDSVNNGIYWARKLGQSYETLNSRSNEIKQLINNTKLRYNL